ncbi:hypothetical protein BGV69_26050 [Burkholderia ubonensis]|nr:hypothetical protein BGV69_26050 [Burkholderia ubonensis]
MLSPWLGARLGQKGFLIWEGLGGVAGGVGTIMLGVIDVGNAVEARSRDQTGMYALYVTNAVSEIIVGGYAVAAGINFIFSDISLIFRLGSVFSEFNPVIFGLTMVILVTSVIIEIEKDPPTMDWVRQCL